MFPHEAEGVTCVGELQQTLLKLLHPQDNRFISDSFSHNVSPDSKIPGISHAGYQPQG
jgi:hypothetical protein